MWFHLYDAFFHWYSYTRSFHSGLYYDSIQNDIGAERAFLEANRLNVATPSSVELAGQADVPTEVNVSETGPEEPISEGVPVTGVSEDQKLPDVHGKNVFFFSVWPRRKKYQAYLVESSF